MDRDQLDDLMKVYSICSYIPTPTSNEKSGKLYLAGRNALNQLEEYKIDHLISMIDVNVIKGKVKHEVFPINDHETEECMDKMNTILGQITQSIHDSLQNGKNVCVHCAAGVSRSATVVADYLMKYHNVPNPLKYMKKYRYVAKPNSAFIRLLYRRQPYLMTMD